MGVCRGHGARAVAGQATCHSVASRRTPSPPRRLPQLLAPRHWADSIDIEERDLPELTAVQAGVVYFTPGAAGETFAAVRKTGLDPDLVATFAEWARQRAYIIASTGDLRIDGWFKRSTDDSWQITACAVDLPA